MSDKLNWELCRSFLEVLRTGSLSAAARMLGLTQPTVARHVEQLEAELGGVKLFTRSPQGLAPTDAALLLEPHAIAMESAAAALVRAASGTSGEVAGVVRISASQVIGAEVLPPILTALKREHRGLVFEVELSNETVDLLRRDADIAVRMVQPRQEALVARKVGDLSLGLHAHVEYLDEHGTPHTMEEARQHALIGFDSLIVPPDIIREIGMPVDRAMFDFRTDNDLAQIAAIRAGFGIGMCQNAFARDDNRLVRVLEKEISWTLPVWVVMHEDLRAVARMRATFDWLAEALTAYCRGA